MLGNRGMGMGGGNLINGGAAGLSIFDQDFLLRYGLSFVNGHAIVRTNDSPAVSLGRW